MITAKRQRERVGEVKSVIKVALETHKKTSKIDITYKESGAREQRKRESMMIHAHN